MSQNSNKKSPDPYKQVRIRILEAQKHKDPDPQLWRLGIVSSLTELPA